MSEDQLLAGDDAIHGEAAYVLGPCEAQEHLLAGHYIKRSETGPGELGADGAIVGQDLHAIAPVAGENNSENERGSHEIKRD